MRYCNVLIARLCPIHLGHQAVIEAMGEGGLVILGSSNSPMSLRHFFNYTERQMFIHRLYPNLPVVGLPDYQEDDTWFEALEDILKAMGGEMRGVTFFGGCDEDVAYLKEVDLAVKVAVNRFTEGSNISATQVRDALIYGRPLDGLVDTRIQNLVRETFKRRWEDFKRR